MCNASWDWTFPEVERSYQIGNLSKNWKLEKYCAEFIAVDDNLCEITPISH